jgi:hypothetical protein
MTVATPVPPPVPVTAPPHFFGLETIDLGFVGDGRMGVWIGGQPCVRAKRLRQQRCGLGAGRNGGSACNHAQRKFQKVAAFHDIFPPWGWRVMRTQFCRAEMNAR